jgi:hypothetical protein
MDLNDLLTCDGWAHPPVSKLGAVAALQKAHYFMGRRSVCDKAERPKYAHPTPPIDREDACGACYRQWAEAHPEHPYLQGKTIERVSA